MARGANPLASGVSPRRSAQSEPLSVQEAVGAAKSAVGSMPMLAVAGEVYVRSLPNSYRLKGEWMRQNGESIYGTRGGVIPPHDWGVTTQKGNTLYVHILNLKDKALYLPLNRKQVKQIRLFVDKTRLDYTVSGEGITILLPDVPTSVDEILEVILR